MDNYAVTSIKGLSDRLRLPRVGKIRLGIRETSRAGKDFPKEVSYFVCPPEVQKVYGPRPVALDVMVPLNDIASVFPQHYGLYGSSKGLKCIGDGEKAFRSDDQNGKRLEIKCPCDQKNKGCKKMGHLFVILPKVTLGGVYQIDTSNINSIVNINSGLEWVRGLCDGRMAFIALKLTREPVESHRNGTKETHYPLKIIFEGNLDSLRAMKSRGLMLPGVSEEAGKPDPAGPEDDLPSPEEEHEMFRNAGMVSEER